MNLSLRCSLCEYEDRTIVDLIILRLSMLRESTQEMYKSLTKKQLGANDVSLIMSEVRKLVDENDNWKKQFRLLHFYCDWSLHDKLDHNVGCARLIEDLNKGLWQMNEMGERDESALMDVSGFLKIPQLLEELKFVLSAAYAKQIIPTLTFVYALFKYLIGISIIPVEKEKGCLRRGSKEYRRLYDKYHFGPNKPMIINFSVERVGENEITYVCKLDGVETTINGTIEFPYCTSTPFEISELEYLRQTQDPWTERMTLVQRLINDGALLDAYAQLQKMRNDLGGISGLDALKNDVNYQCFQIGWIVTGDPCVFTYGETAAKTTTDCRRAAPIYHNLSLYSLQKGMLPEAKAYLDQCIKNARHNADKVHACHLQGKIELYQKQYDDAMDALMKAEEYAEITHQDLRKVYIIITMTDVLLAKGLAQVAISELNRAEQIAIDCRNLDATIRCMVKKAQIYYSNGEDDKAKALITHIPQNVD